MKKLLLLFFLSSLIGACATPVFDTRNVNKNLTLGVALDNFDNMKNQLALWGGTVLSGKNLKTTTELEILAYPINNYGEPIKDTRSYGRFIAIYQGYLELGEYPKDRKATVMGRLVAKRTAKVGDSEYQYPVLGIEQITAWPDEPVIIYDDSDVRFHFGVGIFHHHRY